MTSPEILGDLHLAAGPSTLIALFHNNVRAVPDAAAIDDGTILTYQELADEAHSFASRLRAAGVGHGQRVGVRMPSGSRDLYIAILGTLTAGCAYVPVDADDPDERAHLVFSEAHVAATVTVEGITTSHDLPPSHDPITAPSPEDDAWIIFTSGSTGKPKGVAVTHRNAAAFVEAESHLFLQNDPINSEDRVLAGLSVAFDASCEEMWLAWGHGACLVPAPRALVRSGMDLGPWLISRDISIVSTVPTLAGLWPDEALDNIRLLIVGGEACPAELVDRLATDGREMWNTYGPTEATVVACAAQLRPGDTVTIGYPLRGWQLAVIDSEGNPLPQGETGELVIGGVGLARYLDPAKDAEKYAPSPQLGWDRAYRSGDHVRFEPDGIHFVGRIDDQVKIGGRRIELGEVDAALSAIPGVRSSAVVVQKAGGESVLVGYVSPEESAGSDFTEESIRNHLTEQLPAAMVPRVHIMPALPVTTSGKVDKRALPWPLATANTDGMTETETWLAEIWTELGMDAPDAHADFFAQGGTSLAAANLIAHVRRRAPKASVRDLYDHPRLGSFAEFLTSQGYLADATVDEERDIELVPAGTRALQILISLIASTIRGAQWVTWLSVINWIGHRMGAGWALPISGWIVLIAVLLFATPLGRLPFAAACARVLTRPVAPGTYKRGGRIHLRVWGAEKIVEASGARELSGAPWVALMARALGATVGKGVDLHTLPPATGMITLGKYCSIEPETDLCGYWIEGDKFHVGEITIGARARIGARSTLMPGAVIGADAHILPGSTVTADKPIKKGSRWAGSPARKIGKAKSRFPDYPPARRVGWIPVFGATAVLFSYLPLAALGCAALIIGAGVGDHTGWQAAVRAVAWTPLGALVAGGIYTALLAVSIRLLGIGLKPGVVPVRSLDGWRIWATERLMDSARTQLFPLYASLVTPIWFRLLGAKVGRDAEISTTVAIPRFADIRSGSFLADDTMVSSYELGDGWMLTGHTRIGQRSFLGNSGIAGPGRKLGKNSLVAVLSSTPKKAKSGSNWWGSPPERMRRVATESADSLTYSPTPTVKIRRGLVEILRLLAPVASALIATGVILALQAVWMAASAPQFTGTFGAWAAGNGRGMSSVIIGGCLTWLLSGLIVMAAGIVAALITIAMKWLCVGKIRAGEHPLWSRFVWLNELQDQFVEMVAAPWLLNHVGGTPMMSAFLRAIGASIGRGTWIESYWFPEADLCTVEDGASVGPGTVVQTHLFQDRVMSLDSVTIRAGATLGPHSVALPAATLGRGCVIGPGSLIMRGDEIPANTAWRGNPVEVWDRD